MLVLLQCHTKEASQRANGKAIVNVVSCESGLLVKNYLGEIEFCINLQKNTMILASDLHVFQIATYIVVFFFAMVLATAILSRMSTMFCNMSDAHQRTTVVHLVRGTLQFFCTVISIYPTIQLFFIGPAKMDLVSVQMLDVVLLMLASVYAVELVYRSEMSKLLVLHHVVAFVQGGIAMDVSLHSNMYHFKFVALFCLFVFYEFPLQLVLALYKLVPHHPKLLFAMLLLVFIQEVVFKVLHHVCVVVYLIMNWKQFGLAHQITLPLCALVFACAQLFNLYIVATLVIKTAKKILQVHEYDTVQTTDQLGTPMVEKHDE